MAVYTKKASPAWRKAFAEFQAITGFEFMYQDDIDAGETTPKKAWEDNIKWLESLLDDASNIATPNENEVA